MALDFPTGVTIGYVYTYGGRSWQWNGTSWDVYSSTVFVNTLNGLTGGVTLSGGTYINLSVVGNTITISSPGDGPCGYVSSFNGQNGAVTGVGSFNGQTGAVQGVSSFNGLTGAVTGVTTGTANNFVALQSFNSGISAAGGVTLSGNVAMTSTSSHTGLASFSGGISAGGGTFSSQLNAQNLKMLTVGGDEGGQVDFGLAATSTSLTGGVAIDIYQNKMRFFETSGTNRGAYIDLTSAATGVGTDLLYKGWLTHPGFTTSAPTFNDSTSNGTNTISYIPTQYISQNNWGSYVVKANRSYFTLYNTSRSLTIKTIKAISNATVTTGTAYIGVYSADSSTGLPSTRLYDSGSLTVGTNYGGVSVTNSSGLITVPAGFFYISVTFSSTPTMFAFSKTGMPALYGARSFSGGQFNIIPIADYSGFTHASSLPTSGVTLGFLEQSAGNYTGIVTEILI